MCGHLLDQNTVLLEKINVKRGILTLWCIENFSLDSGAAISNQPYYGELTGEGELLKLAGKANSAVQQGEAAYLFNLA